MENIEVLDRKCKTYDGVLSGVTACITYKQNDETLYLINAAVLNDEIQYEYLISKEYTLYYILSSDIDEISQCDLKLLDELRAKSRTPQSNEEWLLAWESDELVRDKFRELGYDPDEDEEVPGDEFLCE